MHYGSVLKTIESHDCVSIELLEDFFRSPVKTTPLLEVATLLLAASKQARHYRTQIIFIIVYTSKCNTKCN